MQETAKGCCGRLLLSESTSASTFYGEDVRSVEMIYIIFLNHEAVRLPFMMPSVSRSPRAGVSSESGRA